MSTAAISACVGDDPSAGPTSGDDGGSDGSNTSDGSPGDGGSSDSSTAADAGAPSVVEVSSGYDNACAVLSDGTLWCWGGDDLGQLAVASATLTAVPSCAGPCSPTPVKINFPAGIKIAHVAADNHVCAIDTNGDVYCWGRNLSSELGHTTGTSGDAPCAPSNTTCNITPQKVAGIADVAKVTVGALDTCALTTGGTVYCWGSNYTLALGTGTNAGVGPATDAGETYAVPTTVSVLVGKTVLDIDMSKNATQACAIVENEGVYCWGFNDYGQLGHPSGGGTPPDTIAAGGYLANATPQLIVPTPYAIHVATAQWVSCGSTDAGTAGCWGSNYHGGIGNGSITDVVGEGTTLTQAAGTQSDIATIVGGGGGSSGVFCTLATDSHVACWGMTGWGEVGNGMFYPADGGTFDAGQLCNDAYCVDTPQALPMLAKQVSVGYTQTLVLGTDGNVYAWGANHFGQLGHTPGTGGDNAACTTGYGADPALTCHATPSIVAGLP